ncbi:tetratricopeptide repeat protein [Candidatus Parcubacteria bacterium]|nr:MAG: tetratricopeptide repeat protein [Candidatus Parcubacteria bacterium]
MGSKQPVKCPKCDTVMEKAFKFCPNCGIFLSGNLLDARLQQVLNYQREGNTWKAMEKLKELAHDFPENTLVLKMLGNLYFHMGLLDWAIDYYKRAIAIDDTYIDAHYDLGVAYYHRARVNDAISEYQKVLKLDPDYHAAHYRLGLCYHHVGQLNAAVHHLLESTVVTPEYVMAHYHLGVVYFKQGNLEKAAAAFQHVLEEDPDDVQSAKYLETIAQQLNHEPDAKSKPKRMHGS